MKIFAVARNYSEHARELNHAIPDQPVVFMKPRPALLDENQAFYYPDFTKHIDYETELVLKVAKNGKGFSEKFAMDYVGDVTVGIDMTARDLQAKCKEKGWPWEIAKSFDQSAVVGEFIPKAEFENIENLNFHLEQNGKKVQEGNSRDMIFSIPFFMSYLSRFFTLNKGDIVFTGTPVGVGQIKVGDRLEAYLEGRKLLSCEIK